MSYLARVFEATERANYRAFLELLPEGHGGALMDIGTSDGRFTRAMADRVGATEVHGIELIEEHAEVARGHGIEIVAADVDEGLPYPDERFDVVTSNQSLEHVRRTDSFLKEIRRVLKPGGLTCIGTNNLASWHNAVSLALGYQPTPMHVSDEVIVGNPLNPQHGEEHQDLGRTHLRIFTARALVELAEHHGLDCVRVKTVGYYPLPPRLARLAVAADPRHGAFQIVLLRRRG